MFAERLIRKRLARLALAVLLIGTAGWAFLPYVTHRVAASAFVNSELVRVTAPFAGKLTNALPRQGDFIDNARSVNLIEALSPDRRHLFDLQLQYAMAKKTGELAEQHLKEIASLDADLAKRTETYRLAIVNQISHEGLEAEAERAGCLEELKRRDDVGLRMDTLTESGLASEIRSAEAHATARAASTRCAVAAARGDRIKVELDAARNGVFLRNGISDVPYSQQQRENLMLRRQELQTQALQESARSTQLAADIAAERERIEQLDNYRPALPAGHVVWSTTASPGSAVTEGQTILDLADCEHRFVAVDLPERDFEQIKTGDVAAVRLVGSNEWQEGQVRQIRGSAARADDRLFAAQIPSPGPATITVEVSLPADVARNDGANFCGIGRLAEVRFPRPFFNFGKFARGGWDWLTGTADAKTAASAAPGG
ncbi:MAG: HlyD family efflux transporter periplasmic adaptor subunit [Xanthobacteraceae bacterium]